MSERAEERDERDERGTGGQAPSDHRRREREARGIPIERHDGSGHVSREVVHERKHDIMDGIRNRPER